jgi:hypothetical protein
MADFAIVQWVHPRLGRIREVVCSPQHERELLLALKALGIGCSGISARPDQMHRCLRCAHPGQRVASWIGEAVVYCETSNGD